MLTCVPRFFCSWDYRIEGASVPVNLSFNFMSEQGSIFYGAREYQVQKHGWLSGKWSLESGQGTYAEAQKPSALFRAFEIRAEGKQFTLKAESMLTRAFHIFSGPSFYGEIKPMHMFTRRGTIECDPMVPELTQIFAFWLVALTWKRQSQNNSN